MRVMGLDVGQRRIGVALSDELGLTAQPLKVIERRGEETFRELAEIAEERNVGEIVVGLPRRTDGTLGTEASRVMAFAEELRRRLGLPVRFWDERFSTAQAERVLLAADQSRRKRRKVRDKVAAALILQGYLDHRRRSEGDHGEGAP